MALSCIISFLYIKPQLEQECCVCSPVVLYRFSTSNHNQEEFFDIEQALYYIVSLHQTTTLRVQAERNAKLYYIVSLHQTTTPQPSAPIRTRLYYIVSLHQTTTTLFGGKNPTELYYIVSLHQTTTIACIITHLISCIISFLYIKPQPKRHERKCLCRCIISFLYIKPQRNVYCGLPAKVVLYRFSTSNHNCQYQFYVQGVVVLYRFSTSNHNCVFMLVIAPRVVLYRFSTSNHNKNKHLGSVTHVVLYRFSTSNHNFTKKFIYESLLYYIVSLHQTTTLAAIALFSSCCIISFLYIKPQLRRNQPQAQECCIISFLYIKPQLSYCPYQNNLCCIISFLYIKPQQSPPTPPISYVVLYRFSTSNHNPRESCRKTQQVVLYRFSTSNHNQQCLGHANKKLYYIVSLHQTTTRA